VHIGKTSYNREDELYHLSEEDIVEELLAIAAELVSSSSSPLEAIPEDRGYVGGFDDDTIEGFESAAMNVTNDSHSRVAATMPRLPLAKDIIVERMHVHYGLKQYNPVALMRFYSKISPVTTTSSFGHIVSSTSSQSMSQSVIGHQVDERVYASELPRVFEDLSFRVFSRSLDQDMIALIRRSFECWCDRKQTHLPFPSLSQQPTTSYSQLSQDHNPWHYANTYESP
jgi:hypothetical protein